MKDYKHICDLSWCKIHSKCIFSNAETSLKADAYEAKIGHEINSNIVLCYHEKERIEFPKEQPIFKVKEPIIKRIQNNFKVNTSLQENKRMLCENQKCKRGNPVSVVRHNDDIDLCQNCNDLIHYYKTNHELARYFNSKTKIIKLLNCLRELENETNDKSMESEKYIYVAPMVA